MFTAEKQSRDRKGAVQEASEAAYRSLTLAALSPLRLCGEFKGF